MKSNNAKYAVSALVAALALAGYAGLAQSGPVTDTMLSGDAGESWLHTNGNYGGHRYSSLTSLNSGNAKDLKVAWTFSPGGKTDAQATPSYHDGMVFFPQDNKVFALDGSTEISVTDDGGEKVVGHKGPLFAYVHKPRSPGDKSGGEWFVSMTGAKTEVDLSLAILIARAVESLWAVGRRRFTGKSGAIRRRAGDPLAVHGLHEVAEHSIKPGPRGNHPRSGLALGAVHHKAGP